MYTATILVNIWPIDSKTLGQAGVFGDSFGALTSLFSALAFGCIIITIWQQQEELRITRQEIKEQQFENILLRMLDIHNKIIADIDLRSMTTGEITSSGRDCFYTMYNSLGDEYDSLSSLSNNEEERINKAYEQFFGDRQKDLGHYFRFLYNIFKFIDSSFEETANDENRKKQFTNLVRAQLSDYELLILFYNCLCIYGKEHFKPLVVKFEVFDNLPSHLLLDELHATLYDKKAFGL